MIESNPRARLVKDTNRPVGTTVLLNYMVRKMYI